MDWNDDTVARLCELWEQGLSTAEIGRQLDVTKNAVVGKAHRLGLKARPSPIRRMLAEQKLEDEKKTSISKTNSGNKKNKNIQTQSEDIVEDRKENKKIEETKKVVSLKEKEIPNVSTSSDQDQKKSLIADEVKIEKNISAKSKKNKVDNFPSRADTSYRRSNSECCWPIGDPGTKEFHFCGAPALPGKPYCAEHAQIAYVRLRDRRNNVA